MRVRVSARCMCVLYVLLRAGKKKEIAHERQKGLTSAGGTGSTTRLLAAPFAWRATLRHTTALTTACRAASCANIVGHMYEAVLNNRRAAMRPLLELHVTQELIKEWHTLIAELDATLRLSGQYVTLLRQAHGRQPTHTHTQRHGARPTTAGATPSSTPPTPAPRSHHQTSQVPVPIPRSKIPVLAGMSRPRSLSFVQPRRNQDEDTRVLPREAQHTSDAPKPVRPRARSFHHGHTSSNVRGPAPAVVWLAKS